jgi:DNA-binding response OmpR family regulator
MPSIFILGDNDFVEDLAGKLESAHYQVVVQKNSMDGFRELFEKDFHLLIVDLSSPDVDEKKILSAIRKVSLLTPILAVLETPKFDSLLTILHYNIYDYLLRSTPSGEVLARVDKILRETRKISSYEMVIHQIHELVDQVQGNDLPIQNITTEKSEYVLNSGIISTNLVNHEITFDQKTIHLSPAEFNYWVTLVHHNEETISHKTLVFEAQGYDLGGFEAMKLARWHVHELRHKLVSEFGVDPIQNMRGIGYRLSI